MLKRKKTVSSNYSKRKQIRKKITKKCFNSRHEYFFIMNNEYRI